METTRKYDTLRYLDNRLPLTWQGTFATFAAVPLLFVGIFSLTSGDSHSGWWLSVLGLLATVCAVWLFRSARKLRRIEQSGRTRWQ